MSGRRVDLTGLSPVPALEHGARPELRWIPITRLLIDEAYQRPLTDAGRAAIRRIAATFAWAKFSPLMVADRGDGLFAIIDGQHRAHAAQLVGEEEVPCLVTAPEGTAGEAAAFAAVNGEVLRLHPSQVYRAALAAGEPWAVECDRTVAAAGCRLMAVRNAAADCRPREIYAVSLIRALVDAGHAAAVTRGLEALTVDPRGQDAWWPLWTVDHLRPWLSAVAAVPQAQRLGRFHGELDLDRLTTAAERLRQQPGYMGRSASSILTETFTLMLRAWSKGEGQA